MIALLIALVLAFVSDTQSDEWGEVPILPEAAYLDPSLCVGVDVSEGAITSDALDYLLATGWTGDPADHAEALYAPGC